MKLGEKVEIEIDGKMQTLTVTRKTPSKVFLSSPTASIWLHRIFVKGYDDE